MQEVNKLRGLIKEQINISENIIYEIKQDYKKYKKVVSECKDMQSILGNIENVQKILSEICCNINTNTGEGWPSRASLPKIFQDLREVMDTYEHYSAILTKIEDHITQNVDSINQIKKSIKKYKKYVKFKVRGESIFSFRFKPKREDIKRFKSYLTMHHEDFNEMIASYQIYDKLNEQDSIILTQIVPFSKRLRDKLEVFLKKLKSQHNASKKYVKAVEELKDLIKLLESEAIKLLKDEEFVRITEINIKHDLEELDKLDMNTERLLKA